MYSPTLPLSSADLSSQFWLYAYTVGLSLSYLDNTSATAETFAAAPSTTRGHALYFRPRDTEFLLLPLGKSKGRDISIFHEHCLMIYSAIKWKQLSPTLANDNNTVENIFYAPLNFK